MWRSKVNVSAAIIVFIIVNAIVSNRATAKLAFPMSLSTGKRVVIVAIKFHSSFLGCSSRQDGESAIAMDLRVVWRKGAAAVVVAIQRGKSNLWRERIVEDKLADM
jgi:hypothetical protein